MAVIFFDEDQTLWDFRTLMRKTLASTIQELRRVAPAVQGDLSIDAFVADRELVADQPKGDLDGLPALVAAG